MEALKHSVSKTTSPGWAEEQIMHQIQWLESQIVRVQCDARVMRREVDAMQADMTHFITNYLTEVGEVFETIHHIDEVIGAPVEASPASAEEALPFDYVSEAAEMAHETEVKSLFMKLAKSCHPDVASEEPEAVAVFQLLNESYEKRDLHALAKIEKALVEGELEESEALPAKLERLEKEYSELLNDFDALKLERHNLFHSKEYQLLQQVKWAHMCGHDVCQDVKQHAKRRLERKERHLTKVVSKYNIGGN